MSSRPRATPLVSPSPRWHHKHTSHFTQVILATSLYLFFLNRLFIHTYIHTHTRAHTHTHTHARMHARTRTRAHARTHTHTHTLSFLFLICAIDSSQNNKLFSYFLSLFQLCGVFLGFSLKNVSKKKYKTLNIHVHCSKNKIA
jgi:hypothetical protein